MLSSTADLAQARLPRSPASSRSTMPQSCIAAQGATEHTDLDMFAPQICALRCARASCARASYACRLSPSVSPKRPRKPPGLQLHNGFSTSKGGGEGICATAHMASCQHDNGYCALATLHSSCVVANHSSRREPGSPCPVARVPFWSSCARVRKRDEIMSVPIRTQTLHESRSGLVAGH